MQLPYVYLWNALDTKSKRKGSINWNTFAFETNVPKKYFRNEYKGLHIFFFIATRYVKKFKLNL